MSSLNVDMNTTARTAMGTIMRNRLCHPNTSLRVTPSGGPAASPMYVHIV